jgi:alkylhydroperoxidase family enzyme
MSFRLPPIEHPTDPTTAEMLQSVEKRTGRILNLHKVMAHAPKLMQAAAMTAMALRQETELPRPLIELVILRTAQLLKSDYEWAQHEPMALACGIPQQKIDALEFYASRPEFTEEERIALSFGESVTTGQPLDEPAFDQLRRTFSSRQIVELTMLVCSYLSTARFIQVMGIPIEACKSGMGAATD